MYSSAKDRRGIATVRGLTRLHYLPILVILIIAALSALILTASSFSQIQALRENPDAYLGKEVTVRVEYVVTSDNITIVRDMEGYYLPIECGRNFTEGETYTYTGIFGTGTSYRGFQSIQCGKSPSRISVGSASIRSIRSAPENYLGKQVIVSGRVRDAGGYLEVSDEDGNSILMDQCSGGATIVGEVEWWGSFPALYCGDPSLHRNAERYATTAHYMPIYAVNDNVGKVVTIRGFEIDAPELAVRDNRGNSIRIGNCPAERPWLGELVARGTLTDTGNGYTLSC